MKALLSLPLAAFLSFSGIGAFHSAYAVSTENSNDPPLSVFQRDESAETYLFTSLKAQVHSVTNGYIRGTVTNKFTLFPSTVPVFVYLYSSYVYTTDIREMTLEKAAYTADLDMGDSLYVEQSTNGEQKYWRTYAVAYSSENKTEIAESDTILFSPDGTPIF